MNYLNHSKLIAATLTTLDEIGAGALPANSGASVSGLGTLPYRRRDRQEGRWPENQSVRQIAGPGLANDSTALAQA